MSDAVNPLPTINSHGLSFTACEDGSVLIKEIQRERSAIPLDELGRVLIDLGLVKAEDQIGGTEAPPAA